ncbi:DUF3842 family protein [Bullifex porci]|uniref:DUF3842 family protein n=1 Tax=Bullifex porci TaxID=2606638 RepID=UPI0023F0280C|nr:DUF3842 family protein [Bullifex porci]MDD7254722.1 DUF3842 family protein [Bullifex porci]MDD7588223.1 DUF3842 family protein [Bullifex porci]MDY2742094.1 DUF3842 family protein [Bullifex porci]
MKVVVIDGQGGGLGKQVISALKGKYNDAISVVAIGTNAVATQAMLKAGADISATGENPLKVNVKDADVIIGPVGIVIANSLFGEVTPKMAKAVGKSRAKRLLIPVNLCSNIVIGVNNTSIATMVNGVLFEMDKLMQLPHLQEG